MSQTLNIISPNIQGYGSSETSLLPCFGVSGRAVCISTSAGREFKSSYVKILSTKHSLVHTSFVCKAGSSGSRRNSNFSRENRHMFSRNRKRYNDERDNSENLDESEFASTKNGPLLSVSNNNPKSSATALPGQKEREIVELFRKVQAKLREKSAIKEEKKFDAVKAETKESETVDSLLKLLRKHSAEQGKRKVNGDNATQFNIDHPRYTRKSTGDKSRSSSSSSNNLIKENPEETLKPSVDRPVSNFRRRSPVPRVKYEPVVSSNDTYDPVSKPELDLNLNGALYEPVPDYDSESESDLDITSGLEEEEEDDEEEEEEEEEEAEIEFAPEIEVTNRAVVDKMSEAEFSDTEEDVHDEKDTEEEHNEVKDLNALKLVELRVLAKARGMKGFSKLKKAELIGLLSDDSGIP